MNTKQLISDIVTEAAIDSRISDGVVDLRNINHLQIVAEKMYDVVLNEEIVNEFISNFIEEGKHPERQAYNKDGWLVTFPSKEYRDAAIKKGTHSVSDPTHGKGGMNLYYKKKGKQKRQTQQAVSAVSSTTSQPTAKAPAAPVQPTQQKPTPSAPTDDLEKGTESSVTGPKVVGDDEGKKIMAEPTEPKAVAPVPSAAKTQEPAVGASEKPAPTEVPAIDVPAATTPPEQYSSISKKFASKKGWFAEPYGEYRNSDGNTVAVVGLSGEVVPISTNDREEYKIFAEKYLS